MLGMARTKLKNSETLGFAEEDRGLRFEKEEIISDKFIFPL
jgi:hypothetical protein